MFRELRIFSLQIAIFWKLIKSPHKKPPFNGDFRNTVRYPLPLDTSLTPPSTLYKTNKIDINIDVTNLLTKVDVLVPLIELVKVPSQMPKVKKFLTIEDEFEAPLVILQTMNYDRKMEGMLLSSLAW